MGGRASGREGEWAGGVRSRWCRLPSMKPASTRIAVCCVAALVAAVLVGGCRREKKCTVEDQCPNVGDSCAYFATDKIPLCQRNMEKAHLVPRCEVEAVGNRRIAVFCPPDAK